jgi:hypothetical protein
MAALFTLGSGERDAQACGGCFAPPENPTVVTDHRMIFTISPAQSTLYDQIKYQGDPASFAWVLPYIGDPTKGEIVVGISADIVFTALDQTTQTQLNPPPRNCPGPPSNCAFGASNSAGAGSSSGGSSGGVTVVKREVVGPYATVHLKATEANALQDWLAQNNFSIPPDVAPVITKYQQEGFNFLALKLQPGKGVQDMRPVRVTTKGANATLPLRMVAAGTGANVGVSLWVIAEGRYEPQNFGSFVVATEELVWDWTANKSNYSELRTTKTTAGGGRAWETESSIIYYRQQLEQIVKQGTYDGTGPYPQTDEERAATEYLAIKDDQGAVTKTAAAARDEDLETLFSGIPISTTRVTRMRADLVHAALDTDLTVRAAGDQSVLPNVRQVTREQGPPLCPVYSGCDPIGTAPRDQVGSSGSAGGSGSSNTFSCASTSGGDNAWMGLGLGFVAVAASQAIRRRRR